MKKYLFFVLVYALGMMQISLPGGPFLWRIKPDFLLIAAVEGGLVFDFRFAVCAAVFSGIMKDTLTSAPAHFYSVTFALWSCVAWYAAHKLVLNSHPLRTAVVYVAALLNTLLTGSLGVSSGRVIPPGIFARIIVVEPFYTALMSPLVWWCIVTFCQSKKARTEEERVW
jgi:hypothetical protein